MKIEETKDFKNSLKKLKNRHKEHEIYEKIENHILTCDSYDDLIKNPITTLYGFERLKHELNNYYSFNLNKNGGTIRLIVSFNQDVVTFEYISIDHYTDFKKKIGK